MELSERLSRIAGYVKEGDTIADVGTDHAYIPIDLVSRGCVPRAIALDINQGPLQKAQDNIRNYQVEDKIETRLSNGLESLEPGEVDCIIIAGMGGNLISDILREAGQKKLKSYKRWIVSPHSEIYLVRRAFLELGIPIIDEDMIEEDGHYYTILIATTETEDLPYLPYSPNENPLFFVYGKCLVTKKHPILKKKLKEENNRDEALIVNLRQKGVLNRIAELEHDIAIRNKVIRWME